MIPGSIRSNLNVNPRTGLVWASFLALLLAAFLGLSAVSPATASQLEVENFANVGTPNADMQVDHLPGGPTGDPSIDLSHGAVQTNFSLGGTLDNSSPAYDLKASYSSNVMAAVKAWIHDYQAGELGLGWTIEHPRIIRMNNGTGWESDDRFLYYGAGRGVQELTYRSHKGDFKTYTFKNAYQPMVNIQRYVGDGLSYWVVTHPDGVKHYYGGAWGSEDPNDYSDDFKQVCAHLQTAANLAEGRCQSGPIEYGVQWRDSEWGDWVGASQNPTNQKNIEVAWNLSRIESITEQDTILSYINNIQDVGRQSGDLKPKAFSRSAYLYRVQQQSGAKTVVAYCAMPAGDSGSGAIPEDGARPAEYVAVDTAVVTDYYSQLCGTPPGLSYAENSDPRTESPEPDGYQERMKIVYIGGSLSFVAGSSSPRDQIVLTYDFLKGQEESNEMAKRILTGVQRQTRYENHDTMLSTAPPTLFSYWGQAAADGVHVGQSDFSNIFNEETKAFYGAIKSITSPSGVTKTYTYSRQSLDIARHLVVPSAIESHRDAFFSDDYILLVGADAKGTFTVEMVEWTKTGWQISYTHSDWTYPDKPYNFRDLLVMESGFFAFVSPDMVYQRLVWKNEKGEWMEYTQHDELIHVEFVQMRSAPNKLSTRVSRLGDSSHIPILHFIDTKGFEVPEIPIDGLSDGLRNVVTGDDAANPSHKIVAIAAQGDRLADVIVDTNSLSVSAKVYFIYEDVKTRSHTGLARTHAKWCLPNTKSHFIRERIVCAEFDPDLGRVEARFEGNQLIVTLVGLRFPKDIMTTGHTNYVDIAVPFLINEKRRKISSYGYHRRNITTDRDGALPSTPKAYISGDDLDERQSKFPFLYLDNNDTLPMKHIDPDIATIAKVYGDGSPPSELEHGGPYAGHYDKDYDADGKGKRIRITGMGSMISKYWVDTWDGVWGRIDNDLLDEPMKYQPSATWLTNGGASFYSTSLDISRGIRWFDLREQSKVWPHGWTGDYSDALDVSTANCTYRAWDGSEFVEEALHYNPNQHTGALHGLQDIYGQVIDESSLDADWDEALSKNVYVNVDGAPLPGLGCVGAIALTGDTLTTYNTTGQREFHALYPRLLSDGTSVMSKSKGDIKNLETPLSEDDIERYRAIAHAREAMGVLAEASETLAGINYILMVIATVWDIASFNYAGLAQNIVLTAAMVGFSEWIQLSAQYEQNVLQSAVHKLTTSHPDSNIIGSGFSLYNTALLRRYPNGAIAYEDDISTGIVKDGKQATVHYIKKYDPESGVITLQTNLGPYLRVLRNGTIGAATPVDNSFDNMTAGEKNDYYPLGVGRNFITYEKTKGDDDKYRCLKTTDQRMAAIRATGKYSGPCLFGAKGKVVVHRVIDEAGIGSIDSVVVDTVTVNDGFATTKVSYDFETTTAGYAQDAAIYNGVTIHPGGRGSNNGYVTKSMYNGVETDKTVDCEKLKKDTLSPCAESKSASSLYGDYLQGKVYHQAVYKHGQADPEIVTDIEHGVRVVDRSGLPYQVQVFTNRTEHTRDDVTTVIEYSYNHHGQLKQTKKFLNQYDHSLGEVHDEVTVTRRDYAWESGSQTYRDAFREANRYTALVQTASFAIYEESQSADLNNPLIVREFIIGNHGRCVRVAGDGSDPADDTNIVSQDCKDTNHYKWTHDLVSGEIKNYDGKCMTVHGSMDVRLYGCNGSDKQMWAYNVDSGEIKSPNGTCLKVGGVAFVDIEGGHDGEVYYNVEVGPCTGLGEDKWTYYDSDRGQMLEGLGGKCLGVDGSSYDDANVELDNCNGDEDQTWTYHTSNGAIKSPGGKCLDVEGSTNETGSNIRLQTCNGSDNQRWKYDGNRHVVWLDESIHSSCLGVDGSIYESGSNVILSECHVHAKQIWRWPTLVRWQTLGANATSYTLLVGDSWGTPIYVPKRSYIYQTGVGVLNRPVFNPDDPSSDWIPLREATTYDSMTGIPIVTTNLQTSQVSSVLLTNEQPKVPYAMFGNANTHTFQAHYTGFEVYEDANQTSNFTLANGSANSHGYSGAKAYGADSGTVSVTINQYYAGHSGLALLSAWVKPVNGETCQLSIGQKTDASQQGDGRTWQYLEVTADGGPEASVSCDAGGYIDDVLIRPVNSTFGATVHDTQYRVNEIINNNGVVTHLLRDDFQGLIGTYQNDHDGEVRVLGIPLAGFSRFDGFGVGTTFSAQKTFVQAQPNHSTSILIQDESNAQFEAFLNSGSPNFQVASSRFAIQVQFEAGVNIQVKNSLSPISLAKSDKKFVLTQGNYSKESGELPASHGRRTLTWVVLDQFCAVFLDGKMILSTNELDTVWAPGSTPITFTDGTYSKVLVAQSPILTRSFHDGFGRVIQTQSIGLDNDDGPTGTKIAQVLYDGWGMPSVQTKLAMQSQPLGDYDAGWVTGFDWSNDRISGNITTVFTGDDKGRPFTRTRYADSPLLRPERQSLLPGNAFKFDGPLAETFSYSSVQLANDDSLLGGHDLYKFQNFLPYTNEIALESTVITDKAGRTVATRHGHDGDLGYIEWKYQYDYGTGNAFRTNTALMPNYNAGVVANHLDFKNIVVSWDNRSTVTTSQEPDLSGHALVVRDNLGRPRFTRENIVDDLFNNLSGLSYISYDEVGRISETGVLKDVSKSLAEYRTLADNSTFPSASQTCWQKQYLYDTDVQTGNNQKFLTGRVYGLVGNMNLILDNPTDSCFDGEDKGKSYIFYQYDQRGRTIGISEVTETTVRNSAYVYNNLGTRLALAYPDTERMTGDDQSTGFASLSADQKRALLFDSSDQATVHYSLNALGQLDAICDRADCTGARYASDYRYDVYGKILENKLDNGSMTQTREYDFQERLTKLETKDGDDSTVFAETLSYDPYQAGNIRRVEYTGSGLDDGKHRYDYGYDIWGRLISAVRSNGDDLSTRTHKYDYTYDHNGNILSKKITGPTDDDVLGNYTYAYQSGKNQLASITDSVDGDVRHFTHNDGGAITSFTNNSGNTNEYTLDSRNDRVYRVTNEGYAAEYVYDPLNRRIGKVVTTTNHALSRRSLSLSQHGGGEEGWEITHDEPVSVEQLSADHDDQVSAIMVADGHTVEVYEHTNYEGQQLTFVGPRTVGVDELDAHGMNDAISSYKLYVTPSWPPEPGEQRNIRDENGWCLSTHNSSGDDKANVERRECSYDGDQRWTYDSSSKEIKSVNGKCLDIEGGDADNGANIQIYRCHGGDNQKWVYNPHTRLINDPSGKCVSAEGDNIGLYDCGNDRTHQWTWTPPPDRPEPEPGTKYVIKASGGKCLDTQGTDPGNGSNIQVGECTGAEKQIWTYDRDDGRIKWAGTQCIGIDGDPSNKANVQLSECTDDNVTWTYDHMTGELEGPGGRCLDIEGGDVVDGANIQLYDCHNEVNQQWVWMAPRGIMPQPGIEYLINDPHGKCLETATDGDGIAWAGLHDCGVNEGQTWTYNGQEIKEGDNDDQCLSSDDVVSGAGIQLDECQSDVQNQHWSYDTHTHQIAFDYDNTLCIGIDQDDNNNAELKDCDSNDETQQWYFSTPPAVATFKQHDGDEGGLEIVHYREALVPNIITEHGSEYNDQISSLTVADGYTVEAYEHADYGGDQATYTGPQSVGSEELTAIGLNDAISSYKLYETPVVPGAPANLTAEPGDGQVTLSWDDPGDDSITGYEYLLRGEIAKLIDSEGAEDDEFGYSMAIDGDTLVVGSHGDDDDRGAAYVFVSESEVWSQVARLTASDRAASDHFGLSLAIAGDTVVVGSPWDNNVGSAYVFVKPDSGWANATETAKLTTSDGVAGDYFGQSVAIDGDTVVVGAYNTDDSGTDAGSAYLFVKPGSGWANANETAKLTASDGMAGDYFGHSVAVSGDTVAVGAYERDNSKGAVYLFVEPGSGWANATETARLTASDGFILGYLGYSVAIDGDTVAAGAHTDQGSKGAVYLFMKPGSGWANATETAKLTASEENNYDQLGYSVAIVGDVVVAGAHGYGDDGSAYVFKKSGDDWVDATETTQLAASDGVDGDQFGWSVAVAGDTVVVGARYDDDLGDASGSAHVYAIPDWAAIPDSASGETNATSYTITGLVNGAQYAFRIRAINEVGTGPASDAAAATPASAEPELIAAPTGLTAMPDDTRVMLRWDEGDAAITRYMARSINSETGGITTHVIDAGNAELFAEFLSLTNSAEYTFEVFAISSEEGLPISEVASTVATPNVTLPLAPGELAMTASDHTTITINWTSDDITVTRYQYNLDDGDYVDMAGSDRDTREYTITGLSAGTEYVIGVRAQNFSGEGATSTVTASTTDYGFSAPTGLIAAPDDERVVLQWNTDDESISHYQVTVSNGSEESSIVIWAGSSMTDLDINSLENGTQYTFSVVVLTDDAVDSEPSTVIATPNITLPDTPTELTATADIDRITVDWDNDDITVTGIQYSIDDGSTYTDIEDSDRDTSTYTITGLTSDTEYTVMVRALNFSGEGEAATVTATTLSVDIGSTDQS